jgi:thiosulfate dehydrogenase
MQHRPAAIAVFAFTAAIYLCVLIFGLHARDLSTFKSAIQKQPGMAWTSPSSRSIPSGPLGEHIRHGRNLFNQTPLYAADHARAKVSCADCHAEGGIQPFASPVVGIPPLFPMYSERAGRKISLPDRIQECFVRSENGTPIDWHGSEMTDLLAYIDWLSTSQPNRQPFHGRGLITLPDLTPNPENGRVLYANQCSGCHGTDGRGRFPLAPALWGPDSFNDGAGMHGIRKMAAFVQHNMPQNRMGTLSPQQAWDVSAYIHTQPRPSFNQAYKSY